jgi:protein SCO1/2
MLLLAVLVQGSLTVAFLLAGPGLGPWADALLTACFGWDAAAQRYRLDALVLALLEPPLFALVVGGFYRDEVRAFLRTRAGSVLSTSAAGIFLALGATLLATTEISASGTAPRPEALAAPVREGRPAPGFSLVDHRGRTVSLEGLRGRPAVLTFVYLDCHATCPLLVERLRAIERRLPDVDAAYLAVTLAPERDTPAARAEAAGNWGVGDRWHLLGGDPEGVRAVLRRYGVQWAPLPDGEIAHENLVILIDRAGRLAFTYRGLAHPEERQAADLRRLAAERG